MLKLREEEGPAAVAKRLLPKVESVAAPFLVVEGIRSLHEITELKSKFDVVTLAIHASPASRFQRLLSRNRSDDPKTRDVFEERDTRELEVGLGDVIALAETILCNEGSITELQAKVREVIPKLTMQ
jgi:dephospho-CoA kinase